MDGAYIDTTPFARTLPLAGGTHRVVLKNDYLGEKEFVVDIRQGEEQTLSASFRE